MKNRKIAGLSLPVSQEILKTMSARKEAIFFKFMPHQTIPDKIKEGSKLFFYLSKSGKIIIGDARINKIELMKSKQIIKQHKSKLLVKTSDFKKYVGNRVDKNLLVLFIEDINLYDKPIQLSYAVTMGGKYISTKEYLSWKI